MSRATSTPWGPSQTAREIAEGITLYTTASHGGYELAPEQLNKVLQLFPEVTPWAGLPWFEEDCDWAYVALAFPAHFCSESLLYALEMAHAGDYLKVPATYFQTPEGKWTEARVRSFRVEIHGKWHRGSMSTSGEGWEVSLSRGGECKRIHFAEYPAQSWYSDAELDEIANPPAQAQFSLEVVS